MVKKSYLTLDSEFLSYCELNNIKDVSKLAKETFDRGFSILKYGATPNFLKSNETIKEIIKEIEVIKEVIVEVPVEVIKEVRVEIPIEVIKEVKVKGDTNIVTKEVIKQVEIEKPIYVTDDKEIFKLKEENKKLQDELDKLNDALNKFNKATYLKNSDLSSLYDE